MKNIYRFIFTISLLLIASISFSQTLNLRLSNYFYTFQRSNDIPGQNRTEELTTYLKGYQNYLMDFNVGKWTLSTFAQTDEDINLGDIGYTTPRKFNYRFYNATIKGSNLFDALDLKLGRQYVSGSSGRGTIDGLYFKLKLGKNKDFQLIGFGGYLTPLDYGFDYSYKLTENYLVGGQFLYYGIKDLRLGISYANKQRKYADYYALRPDSLFVNRVVQIENDTKADNLAGFDVNYRLLRKLNFYGKAYYDFNRKRFQSGEANALFEVTKEFKFSAGYAYRQPYISYNSIFWVFNSKPFHEAEAGLDYLADVSGQNLNFYGRFGGVFYDDATSAKITLGINSSWFGISFTNYTGYTGEGESVSGYISRELIKSKFSFNANVDLSWYKLTRYAEEKISSKSGILGFTYRPHPRVSIDAQGQVLLNDVYKYDTRFLLGINYWLFTNFK